MTGKERSSMPIRLLWGIILLWALFGLYTRDGSVFVTSLLFMVVAALLGDGCDRRRNTLAFIVLGAFFLRIVAAYLIQSDSFAKGYGGFTSGDDRLYSLKAFRLSRVWLGLPHDNIADYHGRGGYGLNPFTYLIGIFYTIFETNYFSSKLVNCLVGSVTPVVVCDLGRRLFSRKVGLYAALLAAFYPSLVHWSVCNLREPLAIFLLTCAVALFVAAFDRARRSYVRFGAGLLVLAVAASLQPICAAAVAGALALWGGTRFFVASPARVKVLFAVLMVEAVVFGAIEFKPDLVKAGKYTLFKNRGISLSDRAGYFIYNDRAIEEIEAGRLSLASVGRAYGKGVVYFLFSPFPWAIRSMNQLLAYPQIILWYALVFCALRGAWAGLISRDHRHHFLFYFLLVGISLWAMAEGNIGSAFRHRDYFATVIFIYSAAGIAAFFGKEI